jgi:biopolymer transport protein ExbB
MTMLDFFFKGGPLMYVLLALSIAGLGLIISKYRQIIKISSSHKRMALQINNTATIEEINLAKELHNENIPLGVVLAKAASLTGEDINIIKESTEATANLAIHTMEKGLGWISTISAAAPLVGFLGTVTGMVKVFMNIAAHSQQGIDISLLAGGIWEALLTTVAGLVIGIPTLICYNDLVTHVENSAKFLQEQIDDYMIKLHKQFKN